MMLSPVDRDERRHPLTVVSVSNLSYVCITYIWLLTYTYKGDILFVDNIL